MTRRTTNLMVGVLTLVMVTFCIRPQLVFAVSAYWDINGPTPGAGVPASGAWNSSASNWTSDPDGTSATTLWVAGSTAVFSAGTDATGPFSVTLGGTQSASEIIFEEGSVTISGGTQLTLTGGPIVDVVSGAAATISSVVGGSTGLTKNGTGPLTLTAANAYSGGTTINAGTLSIGSGGTTGSIGGGITVNSGAGLIFNRSNALTHSGNISGTGGTLTKQGAGTLTLSGSNSYTGGTTLGAGTLALGSSGAIGTTGTIGFTGGTLQFSASNTTDYSSRFSTAASQSYRFDTNGQSVTLASSLTSSGGTLTKLGTGTLTLSGTNSYSGGTTLGAGTLALGSSGAIGTTGTIGFTGGTLQFSSSNTTDYSARFSTAASQSYRFDTNGQSVTLASNLTSSGGTLTKLGTGTLTLSGTNTFTGGTTIAGGSIQGSIPGNVSINAGGTLSGNTTIGGSLTNNGLVAPGNSIGTVTVGSYSQGTGGVLEMEIAGKTDGTFDKLNVSGTASLGGVVRIVNQVVGNLPQGTAIPILSGNFGATRFADVRTVGGTGVYYAPKYVGNTFSAVQHPRGDMNRDFAVNMGDLELFALALTNPGAYWITQVDPDGTQGTNPPFYLNSSGNSEGNMDDSLSGLDFDDIDEFADEIDVDGSLVIAAIERLSVVPEPNSSVLLAIGILGAAASAYRRGRQLPTNHTRSLAT